MQASRVFLQRVRATLMLGYCPFQLKPSWLCVRLAVCLSPTRHVRGATAHNDRFNDGCLHMKESGRGRRIMTRVSDSAALLLTRIARTLRGVLFS